MIRSFMRSSVKAVAVCLSLSFMTGLARANEFYAGRTITLYVGFEAGGGYDLYARLVGRHLGRFIAGEPKVIVQNMPGAAGLRVANYVYQVAPQDGTALAIAAESVALEQALQGAGTEYDASKLSWVGRVAPSASITFTWQTSKVKNFEDARRQEAVIGATGVTGITSYTPRALNRLAGSKFKLVTGYSGSSGVLLAMERGEVEGGFAIWPEFMKQKPEWLAQKKINVLYIVAGKRAPELPDVPTTAELGRDEEAKTVLRFLASTTEIGRSIFSTPNVPADRLEHLRSAFAKMTQDGEFRRDAEQMGLQIDPQSGEQLQKDVAAINQSPKTIIEKAKAARD
jgi:tripartite-type tricarboxylate transporter receptor subunit TctC